TEELHGMLAGENVWSLHVQRVDLVKRIKNRIRQIQVDEVPVRIHLLHLLAKVSDVVLGPTSGLPREVRGTKIIDEQKAAAVQVLTQVDDVFRVQFQISGLAKIGERVFEQLRAVDIYDLVRRGSGFDVHHFSQHCREGLVTVLVAVMPTQ